MLNKFYYEPEAGFLEEGAYPTDPVSEQAAREQLQRPHGQVRDYINEMLIPSLESEQAASLLGCAPVFDGDPSEGNIIAKLKELRREIQELTAGVVPDGSITAQKLAADLILDGGEY